MNGAAVQRRRNLDYGALQPIALLPDYSTNERGDDLPPNIVGATIVQFGAAPVSASLEGGGLIFDYRPHDSSEVLRVVLEFVETGMWISYLGALVRR
jgi:hypothetical protein